MRHAFLVDPLDRFDIEKDTSLAFMREVARRGHEVLTGGVEGLALGPAARPYAWLCPTEIREGDPWYSQGEARPEPLEAMDVVWMRKDPPFDLNYLYATHILSRVPPPTLIVNDPQALRDANEKLFALRFQEFCPESIVTRRIDELLEFREKLGGEMIIKPLDGAGGEGVFHLTPHDRNVRAILETATAHESRYQLAQRYIPEAREGDKRIILLGAEPIGAVLRVPLLWETRANFHVGGTAKRAELTPRDREICDAVGPVLDGIGVLFSGLDVIGQWMTEINVTSPTGIREINELDGVRLETQVLDEVERRVERRRSS
ncbi:MAG: glutathione synthase [Myxococcota bacterium]